MPVTSDIAIAWAVALTVPLSIASSLSNAQNAGCRSCTQECCDAPLDTPASKDGKIDGRELIELQTFWSLPASHRERIAERMALLGQPVPGVDPARSTLNPALNGRDVPLSADELEDAWAQVEPFGAVDRADFERFQPVHQRMLAHLASIPRENRILVSPCFAPGADPALQLALTDIISYGRVGENGEGVRFEQVPRWGPTALNPAGGGQGDPTVLTYSFPPDGTFIPSGVGEPEGDNNLNAFLDDLYGDRATWRAIYDEVFDRWGELSGIVYVLEPNDDGADVDFTYEDGDVSPGIAGVRGDMRMCGKAIDGDGDTLGYNFFPQSGDMVIDTADAFYNDLSDDSIRLRNILAHEHGHGMGQLHTCPIEELKLMEPFISLAFDGPQFDDTLNAQRHYGDPTEPNDTVEDAVSLGTLATGHSSSAGADRLPDPTGLITLDDDRDVDCYVFTLENDATVMLSVTPQRVEYQAGPQTFFCEEENPYNPLLFLNPAIELRDSTGASVIATSDTAATEQVETLTITLGAGTYHAIVSGSEPSGDQIIAYRIDVETFDPSFLGAQIDVEGGLPTTLTPGVARTIIATIDENDDQLLSTPRLFFRTSTRGAFESVPFQNLSGSTFIAALPPFACSERPEFFISVETASRGALTFPGEGTQTASVESGAEILIDNAETDIGWMVSGEATEGIWVRGVPDVNDRDDPPSDFDGSGQAWVTGIEEGSSNSDVDGGQTILTSPVFDFSFGGTISYAFWASDTINALGPEDGFFVEYSVDNGTTWFRLRDHSTQISWQQDTIDVDNEIGRSPTLQIRFIAQDLDPGNILEAAVDQIIINRRLCEVLDSLCAAVFDSDGDVDLTDFGAFGAEFNRVDCSEASPCLGDFDGDGDVDLTDFGAFGAEFNRVDCFAND